MINWLPAAAIASHMLSEGGKSVTVLPLVGIRLRGLFAVARRLRQSAEGKAGCGPPFVKVMSLAIDMTTKDRPRQPMREGRDAAANYDDVRAQIAAAVALMVNEPTGQDGIGVFEAARVRKTWEWVDKAGNMPTDEMEPMTAIAAEMRPRWVHGREAGGHRHAVAACPVLLLPADRQCRRHAAQRLPRFNRTCKRTNSASV